MFRCGEVWSVTFVLDPNCNSSQRNLSSFSDRKDMFDVL